MKFYKWLFAFITAISLIIGSSFDAWAITIDNFDGTQDVSAPTTSPSVSYSNQNNLAQANAIGGFRNILAAAPLNSPLRLQVRTEGGLLKYSQDTQVTGKSMITWDGNSTSDLFLPLINPSAFLPSDPTGLQSLNLIQDNATAFRIKIVSFDYPANQSITLSIYVYDASDPSGNKVSVATVSLTRPYPPIIVGVQRAPFEDLDIPFSSFTGTADFTKVGAISFLIDGMAAPDVDLTISNISTNGECDIIPINGNATKDQCGVCGGNNSSCADCNGVPNGPTLPGTACDTGDVGICKFSTYNQNCDCTRIPPTNEICDQLDNNCNGQIDDGLYDTCGVCGGNNACVDCANTPFGSAKLDQCGVCNGDGTSCLDCKDQDITDIQRDIDHGAKIQEKFIDMMLERLTDKDKSKSTAKYAKDVAARAHELQIRNWTIGWTLPSQQRVCENQILCIQITNLEVTAEYRVHALELLNIARDLDKRLKKLKVKNKDLINKSEKRYKFNIDKVSQIPAAHSSGC